MAPYESLQPFFKFCLGFLVFVAIMEFFKWLAN